MAALESRDAGVRRTKVTRKKWYSVVGVGVALALAITAVAIHFARKSEKERTLIYQLQQLRYAVQIFIKVHQQKPPTLSAAIDAQYDFGHPWRWRFGRDSAGAPLDPFENPFRYDPDSGWIASQTRGYENW